MKQLAIYGAGGLGREIACVVADINAQQPQWEMLGFYDDGKAKGSRVDGILVLGGIAELNALATPLSLVIAVADAQVRSMLVNSIQSKTIDFPVIIHPTCTAGNNTFNTFGKGTIITAGVIMTTHIVIKDFVLINLAVTIGHDVTIGSFSAVMPGCNISGNVTIGERCMLGTGAKILQNLNIGNDSVVGAGAVVTKSCGSGSRLLGVPAKNTR